MLGEQPQRRDVDTYEPCRGEAQFRESFFKVVSGSLISARSFQMHGRCRLNQCAYKYFRVIACIVAHRQPRGLP